MFEWNLCQFKELNAEMLLMFDEDGKEDQINWFQPKIEHFEQFMFNVKKWISTRAERFWKII